MVKRSHEGDGTVQLKSMNMQQYMLSEKDTLSEISYAGIKIKQTANKKSH